jgi:L-rhamnose mutarotase
MRFGSLIRLKPECQERYIILHKHTFPGVLDRIHKSSIRNYSIFLNNELLFSYFEYIGNDYKEDMAKIGQDPVTQEWWKLTDPMQEPLETRKQGEWWASMEEVFHWTNKQISGKKFQRQAFTALIQDNFRDQKDFSFRHVQRPSSQNIQKCSVFHKESSLYAYFECAGQKIDIEIGQFLESLNVQKRLHWIEMKEVFHTD